MYLRPVRIQTTIEWTSAVVVIFILSQISQIMKLGTCEHYYYSVKFNKNKLELN